MEGKYCKLHKQQLKSLLTYLAYKHGKTHIYWWEPRNQRIETKKYNRNELFADIKSYTSFEKIDLKIVGKILKINGYENENEFTEIEKKRVHIY